VDTAQYQHPGGAAIDWAAAHSAGIAWSSIKATNGTSSSLNDDYFQADMAGAEASGVDVSPYHFWNQDSGTGSAQAAHFISVLQAAGYTGHRAGDLPPMLDLEACPALTTLANVESFLTAVQTAFGRTPFVYTSQGEYSTCLSGGGLGSYPLVVANYGASSPALPTGWTTWTMWQWTDYSSVSGIPARVDGDVFNGTAAQLAGLAEGGANSSAMGGHPADFNGDGKPDIAALNLSGDGLWVYPNTSTSGHPSMGAGQSVSTGWSAVTHIMTGDFDGDGKADIIGQYGDTLAIWRSTSTASAFSFSYKALATGFNAYSRLLPLADYNGDGKPDIAALNLSGDGLWIHRNTSTPGNPSIAAGKSVSAGWGVVNNIMTGDFDGDGKADIVGQFGDTLATWTSTSTATTFSFTYHNLSSGFNDYSKLLPMADFDGDGKLDIAALNLTGDGLWIHHNTSTAGNPSIAAGHAGSTGWGVVTTLMTGDYDGNGKADIIGQFGDTLAAWTSTSTPTAPTFTYTGFGTGWNSFSQYVTTAPQA
jgi:GH25 family lysozyme M1 (1,4-beta-N-acetylmuramidase)